MPGMANQKARTFLLYVTTLITFLLAGACFVWYARTGEVPLLLLGWVTFGTAFDFLSHILGRHFGRYRHFLLWYARINFSALCYGIPFTAMVGAFVIAKIAPTGISATIVPYYYELLIASLAFGALFLFAKYSYIKLESSVELTLDKTHSYTKNIFTARRGFLTLALLLGVAVMIDGINTDWTLWAVVFGLSFIVTVPLHIMHKHLASMLSEAFTLFVLAYGSQSVFVV
ncbi:MAG: hypothetical protein CL797_03745 [Chromatiales bacterium]|nr:hypothetical protein [Chromatiales bacterium]